MVRKFGPALGAVTFATFSAYGVFTALVVEARIRLRKRLAKLDNAKSAYLVDSLAGQEAVKLFGNEQTESRRFDYFLTAIASTSVRSAQLGSLLNAGQAFIFGLGLLVAMMIAARGFAAGALSLGDVIAVNGLLIQLARPMDFIGYTVSEVRQSLVDMDTMLQMIGRPSEPPTPSPYAAPSADGTDLAALQASSDAADGLPRSAPEVRFESVSYTYPNASSSALSDASFVAPAGGMTALVGASGSGKSTCLRLITRLREPDNGRITLWGGVDVRATPITALRQRVGFIAQEPQLFDDSLLWNIRYGALGADSASVSTAADRAALRRSINELPSGLHTRVGERGGRLSGGEKQRVAVARALANRPALVLADEPTGNLDERTADVVLAEFLRLVRGEGSAALVATHNERLAQKMDRVVRLHEGRLQTA